MIINYCWLLSDELFLFFFLVRLLLGVSSSLQEAQTNLVGLVCVDTFGSVPHFPLFGLAILSGLLLVGSILRRPIHVLGSEVVSRFYLAIAIFFRVYGVHKYIPRLLKCGMLPADQG